MRERENCEKKMSSELVTMGITVRVSDGHDRYVVMSVCVMLSVCQWWRNESSLVPDQRSMLDMQVWLRPTLITKRYTDTAAGRTDDRFEPLV